MNKAASPRKLRLNPLLALRPSWRLWLPLVWGSIVVALAALYLHSQPWMGLTLENKNGQYWGTEGVLLAINGQPLQAQDLIEDPGAIEDDAHYAQFLQRQTKLHQALLQPRVVLTWQSASGQLSQRVQSVQSTRPWASFPFAFWLQCAIGWLCLLIGGWVWVVRPKDWAVRLFALTGLCVLVFSVSAACYSSRGVALSGDDFARLAFLNRFGATAYGFAGIAFFLRYPKPIVALPSLLGLLVAQLALHGAIYGGVLPQFASQMGTGIQMLIMLLLMGWQTWRCRRLPVERAALMWLGLSVALGAGGFIAVQVLPGVLGYASGASQGWSFLFFLLPYIGIALGLTRYRLFDVGQWAFRALFLMAGAALLLMLDIGLAWLLNASGLVTLGLALLLVGFAYLPLREWLQRRLFGRGEFPRSELFARAMGVAFAADAKQRQVRWEDLLRKMFQPLHIRALPVARPAPNTASTPSAAELKVTVGESGLLLDVPAVADLGALRLAQAQDGRGLFTPRHAQLTERLLDLLQQAHHSRLAYEQGVQAERLRVAQDLHDDIGARLLTAIHSASSDVRPLLHETLNDVRSIAQGLADTGASLEVLLPELRHETARRCETAAVPLDWPPEQTAQLLAALAGPEKDEALDYRARRVLLSFVREGISNALKHANAQQLAVRYRFLSAAQTLQFDIYDDGCGFTPERQLGQGMGIQNLRTRVQRIGGQLDCLGAQEYGCSSGSLLRLQVPLAALSSAAPALAPAFFDKTP
jgi:signal transduction histidine kinase